jgi:hypothetical protein
MKCVLLFALLAVVARVQSVGLASCSLSGDPHWTTFDGVFHDFQGQGTFVLAENHMLTVQMTTIPCNPAAPYPVTCLAYMTVGFYDPSNLAQQPDVVQYGNFLGTITPLTVVICSNPATPGVCSSPTVHPTPFADILIANGNVKVTWDAADGYVIIQNSGVQNGFYGVGATPFSIVIGDVLGVLNFPKTEPWLFSTVGLCGYFNGNPDDDFSNGTLFQYLTSAAAQRFNGPVVNVWGNNFAVYTGGPNPPLTLAHDKYWDEQGMLTQGVTVSKPIIPTAQMQAQLDQLLFPSLTSYEAFAAMCNSVTTTDNQFQNCMYDAAAVPDFVTRISPTQNMTKSSFPIAQSNGQAENVAQLLNPSGPNTITNTDTTLAIGLGVGLGGAALIALVIAIVYWNRYRFVEAQYSKALIQLNGGSTKGAKGEGRPAQAEIRLEDNL